VETSEKAGEQRKAGEQKWQEKRKNNLNIMLFTQPAGSIVKTPSPPDSDRTGTSFARI